MVTTNNLDDLFTTLQSTEPYLEDDGFTTGVMARLPEATQLPGWVSNLILLVFTCIGSALAAWQLPVWKGIDAVNFTLPQIPAISPLPILGAAVLLTFVSSYVVIWLAQNDTI